MLLFSFASFGLFFGLPCFGGVLCRLWLLVLLFLVVAVGSWCMHLAFLRWVLYQFVVLRVSLELL